MSQLPQPLSPSQQQPTSAPAPEPAPAQPSFQLPLSVATLSTEPAALPFQQSFTFIQTMPNQNAIISEAPAFQLIQYPPPPLPFSGPVTLFAQPAIFNYGQFPNYVTQPFYPPVNGANEHNANHSQISNASTQTCETLNENETPGEAEEETSDQTASREEAAQQQQITVDDAQQTSNLISNNDNQSSVDDQQSNADNDVRAPSTSLTQTSGFWSENEAYEFVEAADQKANDNDEKQQIISEMSNLTSNATETTSSLYDNQQSNTDDCCTQTAIPSIHVPKHLNQLAISNNGSNNDQNLKQTDKKKDQLKLTSTTTALVECITIYDSEDESNGESDDCQIIDPPDYGSVSKQSNADNENQAAEHSNAGQQINKQKEDKQQQKEQLGTVENANLSTFCAPSEHSADYSQPSNEGNVEPSAAAVVTVNRTSSPSLFLNEQSQNVATENDVENSCSQRTGEEEEEEDEEERNQQQKQQKTVFSTSLPATKYCRFCGKSFTAYRFLRNHDRVHTRLKPFQCLVCQHSSAQEANIWTHILAQHYQQYLKTKKSLCRPDQAALCQESAELTRWLTSDEHRSWAAADSAAAAAAAAAQEEASSCEQNQSLKPKRISMSLRSQSSQSDDDANASGSSGKSKDTEPENNNSSSCVSFDNHLSQSSVHNQASTPPPPLPPSSSSQSTEETNSVFKTSRQGKSYISKFFICRQAGCQARFRSLHQLLTHDRSHSQVKPFQCRLCSLRTAEQAELFGHLQQLHYAAVPSTSTDSADQNHRFQRYIEVDEAWIDQERVEIKHWLGTEQCRMKENDLQQTAAAQNGMIIANSSIDGGGSGSGSLRATNSITTTNTITTITTTTTTTITPVLESPPIDTTLTTTFTCQFTSCRQSFASFSNYYRHCSKAHHSKLKLYRCTFEQCDYASVKGMRSVKEHYLEKHAKLQSNSDTSELRGERKRKRKVGKDRQSGFEDEDEDEIDDDEDDDDGDGDNNGNDNDDENDDDENDELIIDTKEKPSRRQKGREDKKRSHDDVLLCQVAHSDGHIRYICQRPNCGKKWSCFSTLVNHDRYHRKERPFQCQECNYCAMTEVNIKRHFHLVHKNKFEKNWPTRCFKINQQLLDEEKAMLCRAVKRLSVSYFLQIEVKGKKKDTNDQNNVFIFCRITCHKRVVFICQQVNCGKKFSNIELLKEHHRLHQGVKPFRCLQCGLSKREKSTILEHIRQCCSKQKQEKNNPDSLTLNKSLKVDEKYLRWEKTQFSDLKWRPPFFPFLRKSHHSRYKGKFMDCFRKTINRKEEDENENNDDKNDSFFEEFSEKGQISANSVTFSLKTKLRARSTKGNAITAQSLKNQNNKDVTMEPQWPSVEHDDDRLQFFEEDEEEEEEDSIVHSGKHFQNSHLTRKRKTACSNEKEITTTRKLKTYLSFTKAKRAATADTDEDYVNTNEDEDSSSDSD